MPSRNESSAAQGHPEDTCEECGGRNVVWFAPNDLWNRVMRGGDRGAPDVVGIVCPVCFILRAEAAGVKATGWLVQPEVIPADEGESWAARRGPLVDDGSVDWAKWRFV